MHGVGWRQRQWRCNDGVWGLVGLAEVSEICKECNKQEGMQEERRRSKARGARIAGKSERNPQYMKKRAVFVTYPLVGTLPDADSGRSVHHFDGNTTYNDVGNVAHSALLPHVVIQHLGNALGGGNVPLAKFGQWPHTSTENSLHLRSYSNDRGSTTSRIDCSFPSSEVSHTSFPHPTVKGGCLTELPFVPIDRCLEEISEFIYTDLYNILHYKLYPNRVITSLPYILHIPITPSLLLSKSVNKRFIITGTVESNIQ